MKMLYYPGFNILDENWIKYALLYLENISPIIPNNGMRFLSNTMEQVINDTDLISPYCPQEDEGIAASLDAMDKIDSILKNPRRFIDIFNNVDISIKWRSPVNHQVELFHEKYSQAWFYYCIDNKIGTTSENGLMIDPQLSCIYMTILAGCICEWKGIDQITDDINMDKYSIFSRNTSPRTKDKILVNKRVHNQLLPTDMYSIPLRKIIEHRKQKDYIAQLRAFHLSVDKYLSGDEDTTFAQYVNRMNLELIGGILSLSANIGLVGYEAWTIASNAAQSTSIAEVSLGIAEIVGSSMYIRNSWNNTKNTRFTRKFLVSLEKLNRIDSSPN